MTKLMTTMTNSLRKTMQRSKMSGGPEQDEDEDGAVLIEDNATEGGTKKKKTAPRFTPLEQRKPKLIFYQDHNLIDEYRKIKEQQQDRMRADSRITQVELDLSRTQLSQEIR